MDTEEPIFVLISPFKFNNNTFFERVAKYGSLVLAVQSLGCAIAYYLLLEEDIWHWYIPPLIFYIFVHIFDRNFTNKIVDFLMISTQIAFTHIFIPCSYYVAIISVMNFGFRSVIVPLAFATYFSSLIYAFVLQVSHRKHYTNDLSTQESVTRLNHRDFFSLILWILTFTTKIPIAVLLYNLFPTHVKPMSLHPELIYYVTLGITGVSIASGTILVIATVCCYLHFSYLQVNQRAAMDIVQLDMDGNAWCCYYLKATPYELIGENYEAIMSAMAFDSDFSSECESEMDELELRMTLNHKRSRYVFTDSKDKSFRVDAVAQSLKQQARLRRHQQNC